MKLSYRGVSYEVNPEVTSTPSQPTIPATDLLYRGARYRRHQVAPSDALEAIVKSREVMPTTLVYRGATYRRNQVASTDALEAIVKLREANTQPAAPETAVASEPTVSVQEKARLLTMNHHRTIKNRQQVMLSRSAAEVGLTANVSNYWNHIQGKIHPSFRTTYDRSLSALS